MVINPNCDYDENIFYISLFKQGSCSGKHEDAVTLLAAKLMSKAPANHPIQRPVISSDRTCSTANTPWLTYEDGELVATNQPFGPKSWQLSKSVLCWLHRNEVNSDQLRWYFKPALRSTFLMSWNISTTYANLVLPGIDETAFGNLIPQFAQSIWVNH